jgi:hypothetical protein
MMVVMIREMVIIAEIVAESQTEQSDVEASACLNDAS